MENFASVIPIYPYDVLRSRHPVLVQHQHSAGKVLDAPLLGANYSRVATIFKLCIVMLYSILFNHVTSCSVFSVRKEHKLRVEVPVKPLHCVLELEHLLSPKTLSAPPCSNQLLCYRPSNVRI